MRVSAPVVPTQSTLDLRRCSLRLAVAVHNFRREALRLDTDHLTGNSAHVARNTCIDRLVGGSAVVAAADSNNCNTAAAGIRNSLATAKDDAAASRTYGLIRVPSSTVVAAVPSLLSSIRLAP